MIYIYTFAAVRFLARNDANKKLLVELGALELLVKMGNIGNHDEQFGGYQKTCQI